MEPDQIVSALRRHAPLALAHIVLGAIIGLAVALLSPPVYSSHTKALVAADGGDGTHSVSSASSVITNIMPTLVEIGTSQSVVDRVSSSTGVDRSKVAGAVKLSNPTNSLIIDVTAQASSPQDAQAIAQGEIKALRGEISTMSIQKEEVTLTLTDIDPASLPTSPSGPSRTRYTLIGGVAGAVLGVMTALFMSKLNPPASASSTATRRTAGHAATAPEMDVAGITGINTAADAGAEGFGAAASGVSGISSVGGVRSVGRAVGGGPRGAGSRDRAAGSSFGEVRRIGSAGGFDGVARATGTGGGVGGVGGVARATGTGGSAGAASSAPSSFGPSGFGGSPSGPPSAPLT